MVRMPDMLMKLAGLSLVKDMEIERGNWLGATKYRSMPRTQHGGGKQGWKRARCEKIWENQSNSKRPNIQKLFSCAQAGELLKKQ